MKIRNSNMIDLPFAEQTESITCGPASLRQVTIIFGKRIADDELLSLLRLSEGGNTDIPSIALAMTKLGINFDLIMKLDHLIRDSDTNTALKKIEKSSDPKRADFAKKILAVEKHAKENSSTSVSFRKFSEQDIYSAIDRGNPVLTIVNSRIFSELESIDHKQHIILISGYDEESLFFSSSKRFKKNKAIAISAMESAKVPAIMVIKNA